MTLSPYGISNKTNIFNDSPITENDDKYSYIRSLNTEFYESFKFLNGYQKSSVVNEDKVLLLNAGVGSGKTTVLVHKILYLLHIRKVPLSEMVVLTFTNKAAQEIKERVISSCTSEDIVRGSMCYFGTFHSVARYLLSNVLPVEELGYTKDFSILDENSAGEMFDNIIDSNGLSIKYRRKLEKRLYDYKNGKKSYGNMKYEDEIESFVNLVHEEKKKRNLMDFDDLIEHCGKLLKNGNFKPAWVIIDEFQDTDSSQMEMLDGFLGTKTHMFAVGDPNQAIYSWRGSKQNIFELFRIRYDAVEATLPVNYRSTATIIEAARAFLEKPGTLEGIRDKGTSIVVKKHYNSFNEALYLADIIAKLRAEGVPYKEIAILYRKQKQSTVFEDVFKRQGVPYEVSIRKSIKDIPVLYWFIRLLRASLNNNDFESIHYAACDTKYGIGLNSKQIHKLIDADKSDNKEQMPVLIKNIMLFKGWCLSLKTDDGLRDRIYEYFDIDNYLSPTSITYEEDKEYIVKFLEKLGQYVNINGAGIFEGIKNGVEYTVLYGNQVIDQIINAETDSVKLMTLHASKGLEFKYVFISGANLGVIPLGTGFDDEEEKRLFFVGITRAKDYLEISYHSNPEGYNALPNPSPFIRMIPHNLIENDEIKSRAGKLSELRREIKNNMKVTQEAAKGKNRKVLHEKYGEGFVLAESDDMLTIEFEGYGEKSFSKLFCPLKFLD